jgi:hypothetical protein
LAFHFEIPKGSKAILRIPDTDGTALTLDGRLIRATAQGRYATVIVAAGPHEGRIGIKPIPAPRRARVSLSNAPRLKYWPTLTKWADYLVAEGLV